MNTTRLGNYLFVSVPGKSLEIGTLKPGDVIRQSMSDTLFVIEQKYIYKRDGITTLTFRRLSDNYDNETDIRMHFPSNESVWHVGELI